MPSKSEKQRKLFGLALSVKRGDTPKKDVSKSVLKIANSMSEKDLEKYASSVKEEIDEATTTASAGAYETPFGVTKKDMDKLEDLKENRGITLEQLEKLVKRTLIREEVFSKKPTESTGKAFNQTGEGKGKETSTKNAKNQKTYDSKSGQSTASNTKKSGVESKDSTKKSIDKVVKNQENNLKDSEPHDPNKTKVQNEVQRIEADQNGMQDLTYDNISDEQQKKNTETLLNKKAYEQPNAQDSDVHQQIIDDAKKRKESKENSKFRTAKIYGSDVEYIDGAEGEDRKKMAFENTIKRLKFKKPFKDTEHMLSRIPKNYKVNDKIFEMYDGSDKYRIRWEGNNSNGVGVILEHRNPIMEKAEYQKYLHLSNYNHKNEKPKVNENDIFKKVFQTAKLLSESDKKKSLDEVNINQAIGSKIKNEYIQNPPYLVRMVQHALNSVIGSNLTVDGVIGKNSLLAIQKYNKQFNEDPNKGYLDQRDIQNLFYKLSRKSISGDIGIGKGNDKDDVKTVQTLLNIALGVNLVVDGIFGRNTYAAILKFNKMRGDENKKIFDNQSWNDLANFLADKKIKLNL